MRNTKPSSEHSGMWSRASIELIIAEFRKRKCLYDQQHPDYLNRTKRQASLENIGKVLYDKLAVKIAPENIKNKLQILRAQFNKDLRGMLRSKKYKPKFWCFKKMEWLKPYCNNNRYNVLPYCAPSNNVNPMNGHSQTPHLNVNGNIPKSEDLQDDHRRSQQIHSDMTSTTTLEDDTAMSSSNILTSKMVETVLDETNNDLYMDDINDQFYETIALTQQIVQNRVTAKEQRAANGKSRHPSSSWEGDLVKSQLDLISDETIRSDTMWEIQCVLRRGIEQDRVLPKRRRRSNRQFSMDNSDASPNGSYISLNSNDSLDDKNVNGNSSKKGVNGVDI